jgi:alkylation response protein AidB-like acyl-CoA dehydrogenase
MNLHRIYNKLQHNLSYVEDRTDQVFNSASYDVKDRIYSEVAKILNDNIGDDLFKPLSWRRKLTVCKVAGIDTSCLVGGLGFSNVDISEIFALFGMIDLNLRDVPGVGHARILTKNTEKFSGVLNGILNGTEYCGVAITEEGAGSDLHELATIALPDKDGYILNGKKCFIARIAESSYFIVFAHVIRENGYKRLTAFLVFKDQPNIVYEEMNCSGFKGVSWGKIEFRNIFIPKSMRIGGEGEGFKIFIQHFTYWRTVQSAAALGSAYAAFSQAVEHLQNRKCFGGLIGRFSHLQQELAYHISRLNMCWLLTQKIMENLDKNRFQFYEACMLKAEALEIAIKVVMWSMKVHGARGCLEDNLLEKRLRDLTALRIADGVTDVLRGQVAKSIIGSELYEFALGRNN